MITKLRTAALLGVLAAAMTALAVEEEPPKIGVEEKIGQKLDLASFKFSDEDGKPVTLKELVDRPVILTLVYYRCPGICTPLLQELIRVADLSKLNPGEEYRIITISFDPSETHELAKPKKANMIAELKNKQVPQDGWRFLTGDADNINRLTDAVGFYYTRDQNKIDFVHTATLIFVSPDGTISRYLSGMQFNPADLELAVADATAGRARSFMQKIQQLCYSYDPEGRAYVLQINRVILGVTFLFVIIFGLFLTLRRPKKRPNHATPEETATDVSP